MTDSGGAPLARAFVEAPVQVRPRNQMARTRELVMSTPISEMITRATVSLTPATVVGRSAASRKGPKTSSAWCSTCCTAAVSASICARCSSPSWQHA